MIDKSTFGESLADGTLRFERLLPGPIERVWDYLTKSALLATWIGPFAIPTTPDAEFTHHWDGGGTVTLVLTHRQLPRSTLVMVAAGWHSHVDALGAELAGAARVDRDARYDELEPDYEMRLGGGPSTSSG